MANRPLPQSIRQFVIDRANGCCEYCVSQEKFSPDPFSIEHILPRSKGGGDVEENLAFSCQGCNGHKHTAIQAMDPINGDRTPLYNPRTHQWHEHFTWDQNFSIVLGKTAIGRATVERLRLNRPGVVNLRQVLRQLNRHPP
ncbi:MAG: HNH endonuclease [Merismopedia sp. SIO2A8]|nr:HNH endonuclease [Merismopedia sp. SIO2A8]